MLRPDPILRPARPEDAAAIAAIHVSAWHHAYAGLIDSALLARQSVESRAKFWQTLLARTDSGLTVLVTEREGRITGFGSAGRQRTPALLDAGYSGEISALYVDPDHIRTGLGTLIFSALLAALRDAGHEHATLWVLADNVQSRNFYEKSRGTLLSHEQHVEALNGIREVAYGWTTPRN